MSQPFRLDGRSALVTGGASGIGEQTVRVLSAAGAQVYIADLNKEASDKLAAEVGGGALGVVLDVSDPASVRAAFSGIDRLDYLVNNAGVGSVGTIEECTHEEWSRVMRVNIDGPFLATQAALPLLLASPHGAVVNIGSVAGLVGVKRRFAYCASKGAVVAMTRQLAADYSGRLRVNCICPGTVDTPFVEAYLEKYHSHEKEEMRAQLNARQPIGRLGKPSEIAHMALYLCSDEAEFVHGATLEIDGGWTAL
jgi:NAD(P)-dependent dehydrogenase (short-subunit alcohol dehydrogenase family)